MKVLSQTITKNSRKQVWQTDRGGTDVLFTTCQDNTLLIFTHQDLQTLLVLIYLCYYLQLSDPHTISAHRGSQY